MAIPVALFGAGLCVALAVRAAEVSDAYDIRLPASFLAPVVGEYVVVGYPIEGLTPLEDARRRWLGQREMKVHGVRRTYEEDGVRIGEQDDISFFSRSSGSPSALPPADTCYIEGDAVVVLGKTGFDSTPVNASSVPKPLWVSKLPEGMFGVGVSRFRRGMPGASWALADENAIVSLARNISVDFAHSLQMVTEERDFSPWDRDGASEPTTNAAKTSRERLDVELRNVVIVARWLDTEAMTCFSLASSAAGSEGKTAARIAKRKKGR